MTTFFTILLLLLWIRVIPIRTIEVIANPLLSTARNISDRLVDLVAPAFGRRATRPFVALVLLLVVVALRGAVQYATKKPVALSVGPAIFCANVESARECILFSFLAFGWMIERLWVMLLVFGWMRRKHPEPLPEGLANALGSPFTSTRGWVKLLVVLALGVILSHATISAGFACSTQALVANMMDTFPAGQREAYDVAMRLLPDFQTTTPMALALMMVGTFTGVFAMSVDICVVCIIMAFLSAVFRWSFGVALGSVVESYFVESIFRNPLRIGGVNVSTLLYLLVATLISFALYTVGTFLVLFVGGVFTPEVVEAFRHAMESMQ